MRSPAAILLFTVLATTALPGHSEENTLERAARKYRIQVYNTFRTTRAEYDQRREIGDTLLRDWRDSSKSQAAATELILWFAAAETASQSVGGELPARPDLSRFVTEEASPSMDETVETPAASVADDVPPAAEETVVVLTDDELDDETQSTDPAEPTVPAADATHSTLHAIGASLWRAVME